MSGEEKIPILALDVDGVIIDGFPRRRWDVTMEADLGIKPERMFEHFFQPHWQDIMRGLKPMEPDLQAFLDQEGADISLLDFVDYWYGRDANVQPVVIEAALAWKARSGGHLTVATNQNTSRAAYLRDTLGFRKHFDTMIVSCEIGAAKPEPEYFRKGDELMARQQGQTVHFLDDMEENVKGAAAHGWSAIHVTGTDHVIQVIEGL